MKTMCPPGYHHNGFVATHALGHLMYSYTLLVKPVHIAHLYIFMARNRGSKSCLMAELCFHHFVHFDCVPIFSCH